MAVQLTPKGADSAGIGALAWRNHSSTPTIEFVEFRGTGTDRIAVFRIVNESTASFACCGALRSRPFYCYRVPVASGWEYGHFGWGLSPDAQTILPGTTAEIQVWTPSGSLEPPFALGINFERGTADKFASRRYDSYSRAELFVSYWLSLIQSVRYRINPNYRGPEPTWSTLAKPQ